MVIAKLGTLGIKRREISIIKIAIEPNSRTILDNLEKAESEMQMMPKKSQQGTRDKKNDNNQQEIRHNCRSISARSAVNELHRKGHTQILRRIKTIR